MRDRERCTTTKLELAYGSKNDPAIRIRREQAKEFLKLWSRADLAMQKGLLDSWNSSKKEIKGKKKIWRAVRGPISAMAATMTDIKWTLVGPRI